MVTEVQINKPVKFTDSSTNTDTESVYTWNFGDGGTSSIKNPTHTFTELGTFNVIHTVTNSCTETPKSETKTVNVVEQPVQSMGMGLIVMAGLAVGYLLSRNKKKPSV